MSQGVNRAHFVGNVGTDPKANDTHSGKRVCNFRIAVNDKKGEDPLWITVVTFEKTAESCEKYVTKGKQVYVEGRLQVRQYTVGGEKRTDVEILASNVTFLSSGGSGPKDTPTLVPTGNEDIPF